MPLPELPRSSDSAIPPRRVQFGAFTAAHDLRWSTLWELSNDEPWALVAREADAYHVRFSGYAHFRITAHLVQVSVEAHARESTIRHLLLDQVLPLALAAEGHLVLHAAGLRHDDAGAIALAGGAGAGKSTLAAALSREGWTVMSDDGVLVDERGGENVAVPAYPGLRLCPDAVEATGMHGRRIGEVADYSVKLRVAPDPERGDAAVDAPLRHVYVIEHGDEPRIETLRHRDAAMAILRHAYRADLTDRMSIAAQVEACARFVERTRVSRLTVPRDLRRLRCTARAVSAHAKFGD